MYDIFDYFYFNNDAFSNNIIPFDFDRFLHILHIIFIKWK